MKSDLFFRAMGQIDDEFIAEAKTRVRPRLSPAARYLAVAASICLAVLALSLTVFQSRHIHNPTFNCILTYNLISPLAKRNRSFIINFESKRNNYL